MQSANFNRCKERLASYTKSQHNVLRSRLIAAGLVLEGEATRELTETLYAVPEPINKARKRTGNLRASRFTVWDGGPMPVRSFVADPTAEQDVRDGYKQSVQEAQGMCATKSAEGQCVVIVGYGAFYALYVHEGTTNMSGQPRMTGYKWLANAVAKNQDRLIRVIHGGA
jgi:hypothetical protein